MALLAISPGVAFGATSGGGISSVFQANPPRTFAGTGVTASNVNGIAPYCRLFLFCYTPNEIKKAYNFPPTFGHRGLDGTGQTIVVVDAFGSPTLQSDLNTFDSAFGIPATTITILCGPTWTGSKSDLCPVDVPGSKLDNLCGEAGWAFETTLDVDMAHALAPGAKIVLVVANSCMDVDLNAAELAVVKQHSLSGSIMSQSFGEPDYLVGCTSAPPTCTTKDPTIKATADKIYRLAAENHWTVLASSGDDGANEDFSATGGTDATLTPSWPATNPYVLAVGGTMGNPYSGQYDHLSNPTFSCPAHTNCNTGLVVVNGGNHGCGSGTSLTPSCYPVGYGGEQTWNEANVYGIRTSSGGGVSVLYGKPSFQNGVPDEFTTLLGTSIDATGRMTPDVSFNAAINGGILNYEGFVSIFGGANGFYVLGGTSASSPAWAAIIALLNQAHGSPVGFVTPAIYKLAESSSYHYAFHDITAGNNSDTAGFGGVDGFTSNSGYDLTNGWGTPNVANFINAMLSQ